jgi:hypothetical protein
MRPFPVSSSSFFFWTGGGGVDKLLSSFNWKRIGCNNLKTEVQRIDNDINWRRIRLRYCILCQNDLSILDYSKSFYFKPLTKPSLSNPTTLEIKNKGMQDIEGHPYSVTNYH